jgi:hypothetical protein
MTKRVSVEGDEVIALACALKCWDEGHNNEITRLKIEHPNTTILNKKTTGAIPQPERAKATGADGSQKICDCGCGIFQIIDQDTGMPFEACREEINLIKLSSHHPNGHNPDCDDVCTSCQFRYDDFGIIRLSIHRTTPLELLKQQFAAGLWEYDDETDMFEPIKQEIIDAR